MDLTEYQSKALETKIYNPLYRTTYPALGLAGEAGEVANKVKKIMRDENGAFYTPEARKAIAAEMGGVLWYMAALCSDLNMDLSDVAKQNLKELASRKERGTLQGSGDNR